jgi:hypothetical protein
MLEAILVFGCDSKPQRKKYARMAKHCYIFDFCDCHSSGIRVRELEDCYTVTHKFVDHPNSPPGRPNGSKLAGVKLVKGRCCKDVEAFRDEAFEHIEAFLVDVAMHVANTPLDGWMAVQNMLANAPVMLTRPTILDWAGIFNSPAICVASGPSLADHIDDIKALNGKFPIFCAESAAQGLIKEGIKPHFVCPQERVESPFLSTYKEWAPEEWQPWIIATPMVHPASIQGFRGRLMPVPSWNQPWQWYWKKHSYAPWLKERRATIEGCSTGVAAVTYAAILTSGPVYLVGHDCAYDDSDESHWGGAQQTAGLWSDSASDQSRICGYDRIDLPGNGRNTVKSCRLWARLRAELSQRAYDARTKGRTFINTNIDRGAQINYCLNQRLPVDRAERFTQFQPVRDFPRQVSPQHFRDWVAMVRHMLKECKEYPFSSKVGNQDAINMVTGCIDSNANSLRYYNKAKGVKTDIDAAAKELKIAAINHVYPDLERALDWLKDKPDIYEQSLKEAGHE